MMPFMRVEDALTLLVTAFVVFVLMAIAGAAVAAAVDRRVRRERAQPLSTWVASTLLLVSGACTVGLSGVLDEGMPVGVACVAAAIVVVCAGVLVVGRGHAMMAALAGHAVVVAAGASLLVTWGDAGSVVYLVVLATIVGAGLILSYLSTRKALRGRE